MNKQNILDVTGMAVLTTMYKYRESFLEAISLLVYVKYISYIVFHAISTPGT